MVIPRRPLADGGEANKINQHTPKITHKIKVYVNIYIYNKRDSLENYTEC